MKVPRPIDRVPGSLVTLVCAVALVLLGPVASVSADVIPPDDGGGSGGGSGVSLCGFLGGAGLSMMLTFAGVCLVRANRRSRL